MVLNGSFCYIPSMSISDQLKAHMRQSGTSMGQLAKESGISQPVLSRFLSDDPEGHRDIRLERTADRLAEYLGLQLTPVKAPPKPPTSKPNRRGKP
jgi:DNA transposition AAA+ family ATPase